MFKYLSSKYLDIEKEEEITENLLDYLQSKNPDN